MAIQITNTFTIVIRGQPKAYTIEANGPKGIRVEPQPFTWLPNSEQKTAFAALADEKARISPEAIQELGKALHNAVFISPIATAFGRAKGSIGAGKGLRLQLQIEPPELASLPWEAMYDGRSFLSARSDSPLVRALPGATIQAIRRLQVRGALRILFVGASPQGLPALEIEQAAAELRQLLGEAISKKRIVFDVLTNATLEELRSKLLGNYHILYFAGHGASQGIYLDDGMGGERDPRSGKRPAGDPYLVTASVLAQELEGKPTRLVFLAACKTGVPPDKASGLLPGFVQGLARSTKLPALVAMQYPISDVQANQLTPRFFESLAAFYSVDVALAEARKSLIRGGQAGRDVVSPVIFLQAEDGALFQRARNWLAIGATSFAVIAMLGFIVQTLLFQPDRQQITNAQRTAQAEITQRVVAETQQAIAQVTARAEAQRRATAQTQADARGREADEQRQLALAHALVNQADIIQKTKGDLTSSILLAVESLLHHTNPEAGLFLQRTLDQLPQPIARLQHEKEIIWAFFSQDNRLLFVTTSDGVVHIWDWTNKQETIRLTHAEAVQQAQLSPDGRLLAAITDSGVHLWDIAAGKEKINIKLEQSSSQVEFSPDWHWMASLSFSDSSTVTLWDLSTGRLTSQLSHDGPVEAMSFSSDSQWLATGSRDATARLWEVATGREAGRRIHKGVDGIVRIVTFSPDSKLIASSAGDDGVVEIWEVLTGQLAARMDYSPQSVTLVKFTPDGERLIIVLGEVSISLGPGTSGQKIEVWQVGDWQKVTTLKAPVNHVFQFHPSRPMVATGRGEWLYVWNSITGEVVAQLDLSEDIERVSWDPYRSPSWIAAVPAWRPCPKERCVRAVQLWDISTGQPLAQFPGSSLGNYSYNFSSDGKYTVEWDYGGDTALIWELQPQEGVALTAIGASYSSSGIPPVIEVLFSPDGKWVAAAQQGDRIILWKALPGNSIEAKTWWSEREIEHEVIAMAFSPDSRWIVSGGDSTDSTVRVWEVETGQELSRMTHEAEVHSVAFSPDGHRVVSGSEDHTARVWEVVTGQEISRMTYADEVGEVAFSPDGRWVVSGGNDHTARVWEAATGREISRVTHNDLVSAVAFSPDGKRVLSAGWDKKAVLWEAETGKELAQFESKDIVTIAAFSPDGQLALTAGNDGIVHIWDVSTLREKGRLEHAGAIKLATFSPDGQWILTAGFDGKTLVWEVKTMQLLTEMWQPSGIVVSAAFSPDGRRVAMVGGYNNAIRVLLWQPEDLITEACTRLTRNLTRAEWQLYLNNEPYRPTCPNLPVLEK